MTYHFGFLSFLAISSLAFGSAQAAQAVQAPVTSLSKKLQLPTDAKNVRIVSLKPAQVFKGLKNVKNPDCKEAANTESPTLCFNEISQPVYDDGIELTLTYESKSQSPTSGLAKCEPAAAGEAVVPCERTEVMEATLSFDRSDFTKDQLAKLDNGLEGDANTAFAKQALNLETQSETISREVLDEEKSQFCGFAPDADGAKTAEKCQQKTVYKTLTETVFEAVATPKKQ